MLFVLFYNLRRFFFDQSCPVVAGLYFPFLKYNVHSGTGFIKASKAGHHQRLHNSHFLKILKWKKLVWDLDACLVLAIIS